MDALISYARWGLVFLTAGFLSAGTVAMERPGIPLSHSIAPSLFGLNLVNLENGASWPTIRFHSARTFRSCWAQLEPIRGVWQFDRLDTEVAKAEREGTELLLELASTPKWAAAHPEVGPASPPRDLADWRTYVQTVATRYKGRVRRYELWNEPNVASSYKGSVAELVELCQIAFSVIKAIDPDATVVSPAMSTCCDSLDYFNRYLALGGGRSADVIGYHFYVAPKGPEAMVQWIDRVRTALDRAGLGDKPLWNTETGWKIENRGINPPGEVWAGAALPEGLAAAYVARSYLLSGALGVERLYWYAWGHNSMGLTEYGGREPKVPARAFEVVQAWVVGHKLGPCNFNNGVWQCRVARRDGSIAWIAWRPAGTGTFALPPTWAVRYARDLSGGRHVVAGPERNNARSGAIQLGPSPLLFEP